MFDFSNTCFVKRNFVNSRQVGSNLSCQWSTLTVPAANCTLGCSSKWRGTHALINCVAALGWCSAWGREASGGICRPFQHKERLRLFPDLQSKRGRGNVPDREHPVHFMRQCFIVSVGFELWSWLPMGCGLSIFQDLQSLLWQGPEQPHWTWKWKLC